MKKITLLIVAFVFAMAANAQVIYKQDNDGESGIISDEYDQTGSGVYAAEDFELTEQTSIYHIKVYGFQGLGDLNSSGVLTGFNLYVYKDDNGKPSGDPTKRGTAELEIQLSASDAALDIEEVS